MNIEEAELILSAYRPDENGSQPVGETDSTTKSTKDTNDQLTHSHREGSTGRQSDVRAPRTIRNGERGRLLGEAFGSMLFSELLRYPCRVLP